MLLYFKGNTYFEKMLNPFILNVCMIVLFAGRIVNRNTKLHNSKGKRRSAEWVTGCLDSPLTFSFHYYVMISTLRSRNGTDAYLSNHMKLFIYTFDTG